MRIERMPECGKIAYQEKDLGIKKAETWSSLMLQTPFGDWVLSDDDTSERGYGGDSGSSFLRSCGAGEPKAIDAPAVPRCVPAAKV